MEIRRLGVVGTGQMGAGIMQVFAQSAYDVIGVDTDSKMAEKSLKGIQKRLAGRVEKKKMTQ